MSSLKIYIHVVTYQDLRQSNHVLPHSRNRNHSPIAKNPAPHCAIKFSKELKTKIIAVSVVQCRLRSTTENAEDHVYLRSFVFVQTVLPG